MKFYRYHIRYNTKTPAVDLAEFMLDKETPKGYWIRPLRGGYLGTDKKWIPKVSRKRYAYPTKEEALKSFIARYTKRVKYLKFDLYMAEGALKIALVMKENPEKVLTPK